VSVVADARLIVTTENSPPLGAKTLSSDAVLGHVAPGLMALGYEVESGKRAIEKISRPVLFGDEGKPQVSYEIDAFHDAQGIAVEVEAGRGAANNADYRDIVRSSLLLDAKYLALLMPTLYHHKSAGKQVSKPAYRNTQNQLNAIYASNRLSLPFSGILLIGY
jgi:hypothetical protein